ncbi:MAG TPA: hypothetical protein VJ505_00735 [Holophagaceae bacterium]|nr:hypothetical protein [Holophagaceae bacterium]
MRLIPAVLLVLATASSVAKDRKVAPPPATTPVARGSVTMKSEIYLEVEYGVDLPALRKIKGVPDRDRGAWGLVQVASGRVPSSIRVKALVDTSAASRRAILENLLRQWWPAQNFRPDLPEVQAFLDFSGRILNMQDAFEYRFAEGQVWVRYKDEDWRRFTAQNLCQAILRFNYQVGPANREPMKAYENALNDLLK